MKFLEEQIVKTTTTLARINWLCICLMIGLLLSISFLQKLIGFPSVTESSSKLYIAAIIIGVISIPISSKIYNKRISRITPETPAESSLRIYKVAFITKLLIVSAAFLVNLVLFYFACNPYLLIIGAIYIVYQMIAVQNKEGILEILGAAQPNNE